MLCSMFGAVAGDLALADGARGGVLGAGRAGLVLAAGAMTQGLEHSCAARCAPGVDRQSLAARRFNEFP